MTVTLQGPGRRCSCSLKDGHRRSAPELRCASIPFETASALYLCEDVVRTDTIDVSAEASIGSTPLVANPEERP